MRVWFFMCSFPLVVSCARQAELPVAAARAQEATTSRPLLLWRVEKDGKASHLLGTCHLGVPLEVALPEPHLSTLDGARILLTELDLMAIDPIGAMRALWIAEGPDLRDQIGEDAWAALSYRMRDSMPAPGLMKMRPWGVWAVLSAEELAPGSPPAGQSLRGLDAAVVARAAERGVPSRPLETFEQQIELLGSEDASFAEALRLFAAGSDAQRAEREALVAICGEGRIEPFEALLADPEYAASLVPIVDVRNDAWIPLLRPELEQGGAFVAVGALHMLGERGLLAQLAAEGYTVERQIGEVPTTGWAFPMRGDPPAPVVLPEVEAEFVARWSTVLADGVAPALCVAGNPVLDCLTDDLDECNARVRHDLALCVEQSSDRLPELGAPFDEALAQSIGACTITGLILDALLYEDYPALPQCTTMMDEARAAMSAAMRGPN